MCFCVAILELRISKEEFLDLTPYDFTLLCEYNKKMKKDSYEILRNTVFNAGANLLRNEGEKEIPLFDDRNNEETDLQKLQEERDALFREFPRQGI